MGSILRRIGRGARTEQGAVAIIVAVCATALLIASAIVLDFGVVRMDRQSNKSAADSAVMAGLRAADGGNDSVYNALGVCATLQYLRANRPALSGLGNALATGGTCATPSTTQVCTPTSTVPNPSQVTYDSTTSSGTTRYRVWIKSPYQVSDASTPTGEPAFPEETLASSTPGDPSKYGCDQIGVVIQEWTKPGLGKLVTSNDLVTRIRSVGRVAVGPGDQAPALLLLDTTHCQVLALSAGGGGAESHIRVKGSTVYMAKRRDGTPGNVNTAGSIHADTTATPNCSGSTGAPVFLGKAANGIVAYGAPDGSSSGTITSVAGFNGQPTATVYDSASNVYGTKAANELSTGTQTAPTGHGPVTRKVIDDRYLGSTATSPTTGIKGAVTDAENTVFSSTTGLTAANAVGRGYTVISNCDPTAAAVNTLTATSKVFIDCSASAGYKGSVTIRGSSIVFNGKIASSANVSLPDAQAVYVNGLGSGIDASGGFAMHTTGQMDTLTGLCTNNVNPSRAMLFVKDGGISATGGLLRLCNTTAIFMGNRPNGCTSSISYTVAPVSTPCGGAAGSGLIKISGTAVQDWTAPNTIDDMSLLDEPTKKANYWQNKAGLEDLALWSESYGTGSDWQMSGGGTMHLVGVFMTPNAWPFVVKGGASQQLSNAQYVASSFLLTGGATLEMKVDANNVISYPMLTPFSLVR